MNTDNLSPLFGDIINKHSEVMKEKIEYPHFNDVRCPNYEDYNEELYCASCGAMFELECCCDENEED